MTEGVAAERQAMYTTWLQKQKQIHAESLARMTARGIDVSNPSAGIKHDQDKVQLDLLSHIWLMGVGKVLSFGARKYAAHNWRKGISRSRLLGACLRHVFAYLGGEDTDPETGLLHLHHASCCLMFASELHETRPDLDDRYKGAIDGTEARDSVQAKPSDPISEDPETHIILPDPTSSD